MGRSVGRKIFKLSATGVAKLKTPGYFGDGGGLWLQVSPAGTKSWIFRYTLQGRSREMGVGALHTVSLAEAREKARMCRQQLLEGLDPIEARHSVRQAGRATAARAQSFDQCAAAYVEAHRAGWRNAKHAEQYQTTLMTYASPHFGALPVAAVDTALVMKALTPIWTTKTETAKRLRGRIESVLAWATVQGLRSGENPARWKGHLDHLLPRPEKVSAVEHHAALHYTRIGEFMQQLRKQPGVAARAVELIVLTACRTGEVFNATRAEFDLEGKVFTVPPERAKSGRAHRVPLSKAAEALVRTMPLVEGNPYLFPGAREGKPLSNMAGLVLLRRMGYGEFTVHGFRSTFRDWCAEQTSYPRELAEAALGHVLTDKTEAAYQRGDLLQRRALMMQAWADYCARPAVSGNVVPMNYLAAQ